MERSDAASTWTRGRAVLLAGGACVVAASQRLAGMDAGTVWSVLPCYLLMALWLPTRLDPLRFGRQAGDDVVYVGSAFRRARLVAYRIPSPAVETVLRRRAAVRDVWELTLVFALFSWLAVPRPLAVHAVQLAILIPVAAASIIALNAWWRAWVVALLEPTGVPVDRMRLLAAHERERSTLAWMAGVGIGLVMIVFVVRGLGGPMVRPMSVPFAALWLGLGSWLVLKSSRVLWSRRRGPTGDGGPSVPPVTPGG